MNDRHIKWGAVGAIAYPIMQLISQGLIQFGGSEPAFNARAAEILQVLPEQKPGLHRDRRVPERAFRHRVFMVHRGVMARTAQSRGRAGLDFFHRGRFEPGDRGGVQQRRLGAGIVPGG